jgi:hypothetical protein
MAGEIAAAAAQSEGKRAAMRDLHDAASGCTAHVGLTAPGEIDGSIVHDIGERAPADNETAAAIDRYVAGTATVKQQDVAIVDRGRAGNAARGDDLFAAAIEPP